MNILRSLVSSIVAALTQGVADPLNHRPEDVFDPATLYNPADHGLVGRYGNWANLAQNSNGTTPVTAFGQRCGYSLDLSGKGNHQIMATAASRPYVSGLPLSYGAELVPNPRFTSDTFWNKGTGWAIVGGRATKVAGVAAGISGPIALTAGKHYVLMFNAERTGGTIVGRFTGGTTISGSSRNATGSYYELLIAADSNTTLELFADASFVGSVFNVTCREVTSFTCPGLRFFGSPNELTQTATINMSGSSKATIGVWAQQDNATGSQNVLIHGAYGATPGSVLMDFATQPFCRAWGTAGAVVTVPATERGNGIAGRAYSNIYSIDFVGASIAAQVHIQCRGVVPTQTTSGSLNGSSALANARFRIGASSFRGLITDVVHIDRTLTTEERASVDAMLMEGKCYGAVLGDSTVSATFSPTPNAQRISDFIAGLVTGGADVSEQGSRIADQVGYWNTLIVDKSKLQVVVLMIGLNDVKGRVGANTATAAQVIADLQGAVTTVNATKPVGCKVVICGLIPCKLWLDAATNPSAAYAAWLAVNEAIAGNGPTPITGVDVRVTSHVALGHNGDGYLYAIYDHEGLGVHESNEYRMPIGWAIRTGIEGLGLLPPPIPA